MCCYYCCYCCCCCCYCYCCCCRYCCCCCCVAAAVVAVIVVVAVVFAVVISTAVVSHIVFAAAVVVNYVLHLQNSKYRRIPTRNIVYQRHVGNSTVGQRLLHIAGFRLTSTTDLLDDSSLELIHNNVGILNIITQVGRQIVILYCILDTEQIP